MTELIVREAIISDNVARQSIIDATTRELRKIYKPREKANQCSPSPATTLVAVKQNTVMGTAEYVIKHDHIYLQGIAVHPDHRRQGICRCLVVATEALARKVKVDTLKLCVIQETGNIEIFKQLGFSIISHAISQGYVNPDGGVVTQVEMERKIL
ncbi:MAG TPA: GNAT family N-acetyltransferase [Gammaproteobacteria bacterium]